MFFQPLNLLIKTTYLTILCLCGGEPGIFGVSYIFSLNCSASDHLATGPPTFVLLVFPVHLLNPCTLIPLYPGTLVPKLLKSSPSLKFSQSLPQYKKWTLVSVQLVLSLAMIQYVWGQYIPTLAKITVGNSDHRCTVWLRWRDLVRDRPLVPRSHEDLPRYFPMKSDRPESDIRNSRSILGSSSLGAL